MLKDDISVGYKMTSVVIYLSSETSLEMAKPLYPQNFSICITQNASVVGRVDEKTVLEKIQVNLSIKEYEILKQSLQLIDGLVKFCKDQDPLVILQ